MILKLFHNISSAYLCLFLFEDFTLRGLKYPEKETKGMIRLPEKSINKCKYPMLNFRSLRNLRMTMKILNIVILLCKNFSFIIAH